MKMTANEVCAMTCIIIAVCFFVLAMIFAFLKEKGAILISGFNTLTKKQREDYNTQKMSRDMRNQLLLWTLVLMTGALLSYFISFYFAIISFVIWLILFFENVHLDSEKAFGRYKR